MLRCRVAVISVQSLEVYGLGFGGSGAGLGSTKVWRVVWKSKVKTLNPKPEKTLRA